MTKQYRPSMFRGAANRDDNEPMFRELLDRWQVQYSQGKPGDGYDLLIQIHPMRLWEIKNNEQPPSAQRLTPAELAKQAYCRSRGIPYDVLRYTDEAVKILTEHFEKQKGRQR